MPVSRRTALKALALPAVSGIAGLGAAGCAAGPSLNVAVVWTGWELRQFQKVVDGFTARTGIRCQLLSMGDDTSAFLNNEVTGAAQPDVALVPQPGTVLSNRSRLTPLPWPPDDADSWRGLLEGSGGEQYGAWYKASYNSMVWHRHTPDVAPPPGGWDWNSWTAWCLRHAGGRQAPLSIGAADGWVLAGWFSNVLLAFHPDSYSSLVKAYWGLAVGADRAETAAAWRDPGVADALYRLAAFWRHDGLFPGGGERALATQFDQSVLDVFGTGEAAMVAGADYYWPIITQYTPFPPSDVRWFPFPGAAPGRSPVITGGDAAVQFARTGREQDSRRLIEWLSDPRAASIWAEQGGFLSIDRQVSGKDYGYPGSMQVPRLRSSVLRPGARFNLSDLLSGPLAGDDGEGIWKVFTDFFTDVAVRRVGPGVAVGNATRALANGDGGA